MRGIALLLGVVVHASMSWLPGAQYFWVTHDDAPSAVAGLAFHVPHMFRMLLFFLLAGFFARMGHQRLGTRRFVRDRFKRIAVPLLAGWFPVLAAIVAVAAWSAYLTNHGVMPPPPPTPPLTPGSFPLTHLWFLYVLLLCYVVAVPLAASLGRSAAPCAVADRAMRVLASTAGPVLLALPLCAALYVRHDWMMWFGIPTPDQSLYPNIAACTAFGSAFAFGWLLQRQPDLLRGWASRWPWHLALAVAGTGACLAATGLAPQLTPAPHDRATLAYAACYAFTGWNWTFALVGLGMRFLSGHSPARRYLADASYWIYLVHLPLVMALQVVASRIAWPWFVEFPLLLAVAMALMLASYRLFVRDTFIGAVLNGRRGGARAQNA